ncbi:hypothetical protein [Chondrinema litorale]|uniref:hypothetical protein n=1 Tax=Chondrinema litorale TaxID=2994555 RepID=UPI0025427EC6|nr:hypothetical protein [Chondrinema litorale]UZR98647.1 hypothetical protein OQ292_32990 [Chondrinema litorale]
MNLIKVWFLLLFNCYFILDVNGLNMNNEIFMKIKSSSTYFTSNGYRMIYFSMDKNLFDNLNIEKNKVEVLSESIYILSSDSKMFYFIVDKNKDIVLLFSSMEDISLAIKIGKDTFFSNYQKVEERIELTKYGKRIYYFSITEDIYSNLLAQYLAKEIKNQEGVYYLSNGLIIQSEKNRSFFLYESLDDYTEINKLGNSLTTGINSLGLKLDKEEEKEQILKDLSSKLTIPSSELTFSIESIKVIDHLIPYPPTFREYHNAILFAIIYSGEVFIKNFGGYWKIDQEDQFPRVYKNGEPINLESFFLQKLHPDFYYEYSKPSELFSLYARRYGSN